MKDDALFTVLIVAVCAAGFASQWEAVERFLSTVFSWLLLGGGGALLVVVLVREARDAWLDQKVLGPRPARPARVKRKEPKREEVGK